MENKLKKVLNHNSRKHRILWIAKITITLKIILNLFNNLVEQSKFEAIYLFKEIPKFWKCNQIKKWAKKL